MKKLKKAFFNQVTEDKYKYIKENISAMLNIAACIAAMVFIIIYIIFWKPIFVLGGLFVLAINFVAIQMFIKSRLVVAMEIVEYTDDSEGGEEN